jgi:hypothetical protein
MLFAAGITPAEPDEWRVTFPAQAAAVFPGVREPNVTGFCYRSAFFGGCSGSPKK